MTLKKCCERHDNLSLRYEDTEFKQLRCGSEMYQKSGAIIKMFCCKKCPYPEINKTEELLEAMKGDGV